MVMVMVMIMDMLIDQFEFKGLRPENVTLKSSGKQPRSGISEMKA